METVSLADPESTNFVEMRKERRSDNAERYALVNKEWPEDVPALTQREAIAATKQLWRYATKQPWNKKRKIVFTSGNRYPSFRRGEFRINLAWHGDKSQGWKAMVHVLSHYALHVAKPGHPDHGTAHASLERDLIREVIRRGWLGGKLRAKEKAPKVRDIKAERHASVLKRIRQWTTKLKRAETALKKLRKQQSYYAKIVAAVSA